MCLAVPMSVISVEGDTALVNSFGVDAEVSTVLLENVEPGDYVIVHSGYAIQRLERDEALETLEIFRRMEDV